MSITRKWLAIITALAVTTLVLLVGGCTWWMPGGRTGAPLTLLATPTSGHPSVAAGGLAVEFTCSGGDGKYILDAGDGSPVVTYAASTFTHVYSRIGTFHAVVRSGGYTEAVDITTINHAPHVYQALVIGGVDWLGKVLLDARWREHGCHNGMPISVTGAIDPDGDPLQYTWQITGPNKDGTARETYSVFAPDHTNITGKQTDDAVVVFFPGWTAATPPYPFAPVARTQALSSDPTPEKVTITLRVCDPWGGTAVVTWMVDLASTGCTEPKQ